MMKNWLPDEHMQAFLKKHTHYSEEHMKNWSLFVKMMRAQNRRPPSGGKKAFFGVLHDCDSTSETNEEGNPNPNKDGWEQYCFGDPYDLACGKLFVEFHLDWEEWKNTGNEEGWKEEQALVERLCKYMYDDES
ncbi:expressed unknown protein [Seminavis robusta]|uniref:Uncharacterized protein n=1 Tax=Seminavis robusta TaxID=568900 RepID=A0A9N8E8S7_9STRA|nr:expressed unknown protein [Seminavis robusta]|eukprot:Sro810_g205680.1 n/a (133) ;mRNA; f:3952-4350